LELSDEELATVGAVVGSDVAFFVCGGTALVEGKGERLTSLRDAPETWVVLIVPPVSPVSKTVSMYESLTEDDFTDGSNTIAAAEEVRHGKVIDDWHMRNVFGRAVFECFPDLVAYRYSLLRAGASAVYLAGSGPGLVSRSTDRVGAAPTGGVPRAERAVRKPRDGSLDGHGTHDRDRVGPLRGGDQAGGGAAACAGRGRWVHDRGTPVPALL